MKQVLLISITLQIFFLNFGKGLQCFSCENESSMFFCMFRGQVITCAPNQDSCLTVVRRCGSKLAFWKGCKQAAACLTSARLQVTPTVNGLTECNTDQESSACTCCCEDERCNVNSRPCNGMTFDCEDRGQTINGTTVCSDGSRSGSICTHTCNNPEIMPFPTDETVCLRSGDWDQPLPTCLIDCEERGQTRNGVTMCSDGNRSGSICTHVCNNPNVTPTPDSESICMDIGEWNQPLPNCDECEDRFEIANGTTECTDGNEIGSICIHSCNDPNLQPSLSSDSVCLDNGEWNQPLPCCTRNCPPLLLADVLLMKQAMSEESFEGFRNRSLLLSELFSLGPDSMYLGVSSYTSSVSIQGTIVLIQNAARRNGASLRAIENLISTTGVSNIRTGNALLFVLEQYFNVDAGDRPNVQNIVVLEMDTVSVDPVDEVAAELREQGVTIFALASSANTDPQYMQQLIQITGSINNILTEEDPMTYVQELAARLCQAQCDFIQ